MILAEDEPAVQPASRQSSESDDLPGIAAVHRAFRHTGRNDLERKPLKVLFEFIDEKIEFINKIENA